MRLDVRRLEEVSSTNDEAKRLAAGGAAEGTVVVAERQTAGRGRRGRVWASVPGNLFLSIVLRPAIAPAAAPPLAPAIGLAVALAIEDVAPLAEHFLKIASQKLMIKVPVLTKAQLEELEQDAREEL